MTFDQVQAGLQYQTSGAGGVFGNAFAGGTTARERLSRGSSGTLDMVRGVLRAEQAGHKKIMELEATTSVAGWDGAGGEPVTPRQWDDARLVLSRCVRELLGVPAPFVSAGGDGAVYLQWTTPGGDRCVIEIGRDEYWWSLLPASSEEGSGDVDRLSAPFDAFEKIRHLFG